MSKLRSSSRKWSQEHSPSRLVAILRNNHPSSLRSKHKLRESKIFEETRCHTEPDGPQQYKDTLYNK